MLLSLLYWLKLFLGLKRQFLSLYKFAVISSSLHHIVTQASYKHIDYPCFNDSLAETSKQLSNICQLALT